MGLEAERAWTGAECYSMGLEAERAWTGAECDVGADERCE